MILHAGVGRELLWELNHAPPIFHRLQNRGVRWGFAVPSSVSDFAGAIVNRPGDNAAVQVWCVQIQHQQFLS